MDLSPLPRRGSWQRTGEPSGWRTGQASGESSSPFRGANGRCALPGRLFVLSAGLGSGPFRGAKGDYWANSVRNDSEIRNSIIVNLLYFGDNPQNSIFSFPLYMSDDPAARGFAPGINSMPMTLNCPKCRKPFRVRDDSAGMRVKCPTCGAVLQVPASLTPASMDSSKPGVEPVPVAPTPAPEPPQHAAPIPAPPPAGKPLPQFDNDAEVGPQSLPPFPATRKRVDEDADELPRPKSRRSIDPPPMPKKPAKRSNERGDTRTETEKIIDEYVGWRKVKKGLGWLQFAFFLAMFPAIGQFGVAAYCRQTEAQLPDNFATADLIPKNQIQAKATREGLLGKHELSLWKEAEIVYAYGIPLLAFLCALIGLLKCTNVPEIAKTRGVAGGTLFLTFIAFAAFAAYVAQMFLPIFGQKIPLPGETEYISWTVFVFIGLTAIGWLCIFLGQAGFTLNSTRALRDVAMSLLAAVVLIGGVLIGNLYYPLLVSNPRMNWDDLANTYMIQTGAYMLISMVVGLRMMSLIGIIRRGIKRFREANQHVLDGVR
jgi:predicted Zn finger-like uncharacterized protein